MKAITEGNLKDALAGESQAHVKYAAFADQAEREGLANVARLFRAASYSEQMHATNHLRALGGLNKTAQNLDAAFGGESFEITEMYPAYIQVAQAQEEKRAQTSMVDAMAAEKVHAKLYAEAKQAVAGGTDVELAKLWVCSVCGFTGEGEEPDRCPQCNAVRSKIHSF
jgi:rubrerythrin